MFFVPFLSPVKLSNWMFRLDFSILILNFAIRRHFVKTAFSPLTPPPLVIIHHDFPINFLGPIWTKRIPNFTCGLILGPPSKTFFKIEFRCEFTHVWVFKGTLKGTEKAKNNETRIYTINRLNTNNISKIHFSRASWTRFRGGKRGKKRSLKTSRHAYSSSKLWAEWLKVRMRIIWRRRWAFRQVRLFISLKLLFRKKFHVFLRFFSFACDRRSKTYIFFSKVHDMPFTALLRNSSTNFFILFLSYPSPLPPIKITNFQITNQK